MLTDNIKYTTFDYEFSSQFKNISEQYGHIQLPYSTTNKSDRKILFVLDYMPTEDLRSKKLLSGVTRDLLNTLHDLANSIFRKNQPKEQFSWMACTFNAFRTAGRGADFSRVDANAEFTKRINKIITKYKPDTVVVFGDRAFNALCPEQSALTDGTASYWYGTQIKRTIKHGDASHDCKFFSNISLNSLVTDVNCANLLGYMARRFAHAITGKDVYALSKEDVTHKSIYVDTLKKFDRMMDYLRVQPVVSVDTETKNLNKVTNKLLTIQFAATTDQAFFVPIYHKDTPFTSKELRHIVKSLKAFFEGHNDNDYHVYTNALFDLNVLRTELNIPFMENDVWDILAGEYLIDENLKVMSTVTGHYYYSLGNLAVQYGFTGYLTAEFGKKHRAGIANATINKALIEYGTLDVVIPLAIHAKQQELAHALGHTKYKSLVRQQYSDLIHGFSTMSVTGSLIDIDYLFVLQSPQSPIQKVINEMEAGLMGSEAVRIANKRVAKAKGMPTQSLFGPSTGSTALVSTDSTSQNLVPSNVVFDLSKNDHKHLLFFDVLKLDPLSQGKSGKGKLDKAFQKHYKNVPEVKMYTELEKAKKLRNAFVKSFIKLLGISEDFAHDKRIRAAYHYLKVVTGRTSASDPNLQQIPSHSELGKHIKRLFVAPKGYLYVKVDYRVHEVRGWGLISFDKGIANLFEGCKALRDEYRVRPTAKLRERLKSEADVHVMNAMYFFGVTLDKVLANDKELRNAVKAVIFGLIYQMATKTLAQNLGKPLEFTEKLVGGFNKRFPSGMKWIDTTKAFAKKYFYYENPFGFRRHVWGLALPSTVEDVKRIYATMLRQIVNSPIQGMSAQFVAVAIRQLDRTLNDIRKNEDRIVDLKICNSVHDSGENIAAYANVLESIGLIEDSYTNKVKRIVAKRVGFLLNVDLEIDFEIGSNLSTCKGWDFSLEELEKIIFNSLLDQRFKMGYEDLDVVASMGIIFNDGWERAPSWLKKQAKNIGWEYDRSKYVKMYKAYLAEKGETK